MKPDFILFTDGSLRRWKEGDKTKTTAAYAVAILNTATNQYTVFSGALLNSDSIAYIEAFALYKGITYLKAHAAKKSRIAAVSDNKLLVSTFMEYIPSKWDLSDYEMWKKANGDPVKNQELLRDILNIIQNKKFQFRMVHINSHLTRDKAKETYRKLKEKGINCSVCDAELFIRMNHIVDEEASTITMNHKTKKESEIELWRIS